MLSMSFNNRRLFHFHDDPAKFSHLSFSRSLSAPNSACAFHLSSLVPHVFLTCWYKISNFVNPSSLSSKKKLTRIIGSESMREKINIFRKSGKKLTTAKECWWPILNVTCNSYTIKRSIASCLQTCLCSSSKQHGDTFCLSVIKVTITWNYTYLDLFQDRQLNAIVQKMNK